MLTWTRPDLPLIRFTPHDCIIRVIDWRRPVLRDLIACAKETCEKTRSDQLHQQDDNVMRQHIFDTLCPEAYQQLLSIGYDCRVNVTDRRCPWQSFCMQRNRCKYSAIVGISTMDHELKLMSRCINQRSMAPGKPDHTVDGP